VVFEEAHLVGQRFEGEPAGHSDGVGTFAAQSQGEGGFRVDSKGGQGPNLCRENTPGRCFVLDQDTDPVFCHCQLTLA
jgi:hypothetical protein